MSITKVVELKNAIAATRSALLAAQSQETGHNLTLLGVKNETIKSLRKKLSDLTDALSQAQTAEAIALWSTPKQPQQQERSRYSKNDTAIFIKRYLQTGSVRELRDINTTNGGVLIPQNLLNIVDALKFYSNIAGDVLIHQGAGYVKVPVASDTGNSVTLVGETATSAGAKSDPGSISSSIIGTDALITNIDISIQELNSGVDLTSWLRSRIFTRIGRGLEAAVTGGVDGSGAALPNSPVGGLLAGLSVGATVGTAHQVGFADLAALKNSLDPAYLVGAKWYASPTVYSYVDSLQTTTGAKVFDYDGNGVLQVLGLPFLRNASMPALTAATGSPLVTLGRYDLAYQISLTQPSVRFLSQLPNYAERLMQRYQGVVRFGASPLVSGAVKTLAAR